MESEPKTSSPRIGLEPGTLLDAKLRIVRLLGMGGMGAVYEVVHELTHHRRAVKLLHPHHAARKETVERFLREASAAGKIGSPYIVETFDAGWLQSGVPYLVMEFLEGVTLGDRLDEFPSGMPLVEVAPIFAQVCEGVQAAHDAGIVHRDLKPDNIFLSGAPPAWRVKLLDFGVSKFDDRHTRSGAATEDGAFLGTPAYMSPEQFVDGSEVDARSDVYSLGVIVYQCLAGEHPYPAKSIALLARTIASATIPPLSARRPDLPRSIDGVLEKALRKDPASRLLPAKVLGEHLRALAEEAAVADTVQAASVSALALGDTVAVSPAATPAIPMRSARRWWIAGAIAVLVAAFGTGRFLRSSSNEAPAPSTAPPVPAAPQPEAPSARPSPPPGASSAPLASASATAAPRRRLPVPRPDDLVRELP